MNTTGASGEATNDAEVDEDVTKTEKLSDLNKIATPSAALLSVHAAPAVAKLANLSKCKLLTLTFFHGI